MPVDSVTDKGMMLRWTEEAATRGGFLIRRSRGCSPGVEDCEEYGVPRDGNELRTQTAMALLESDNSE